ncbi:MAG: N-glycosylase/DNA lyase [Candidatus Diapherotrites archaeon]|nr:N-glycosylase/DNA lyase [Candidatus Diapherotrites archaeon]
MGKPKLCIPTNIEIRRNISSALRSFKKTWNSDEKIFEELCFCLLTPQSSAKQALKTIELLKEHKLLFRGSAKQKEKFLKNVRFYKTKAVRLEEAQKKFPKNKIKKILMQNGLPSNPLKCREFLVREVNGYGMKEASHFLRNIGFGEEVAILDRHILKNLKSCGIIGELPKTLAPKKYLETELKMKRFCKRHAIDFGELDLVFWSNETGKVLK